MPNYAIRVELRGAPTAQQYQNLHVLMRNMGFLLTVRGAAADGSMSDFNLPHGIYFGASMLDCATVRTTVTNAIKAQIQPEVMVFVVESVTWAMGW